MKESEIIKGIIDRMEYLKTGLCSLEVPMNLEYQIWIKRNAPEWNYSKKEYWFPIYSWPVGDADRRYYWLKSKLEKALENESNE